MQRAVERRGIPTVSITVARDITEHVKPPRALFVPFMMGHHFGVPFHRELQRRVILAALERLSLAQESGESGESGEIVARPVTWAQARREGREIEQRLLAADA